MEQTTTPEPQLEQSIARLKSVVTALEIRISGLIEKSKQSEDVSSQLDEQQLQLHILQEQVSALKNENTALTAKLADAENNYAKLRSISQDVQGQIDNAINDLHLLLEKETVDS